MTPFGGPAMSGPLRRRVFRLPWGCPLTLTIRSVRLGLNVQTFRLAIHLNLFRGDSAVLCGIVEGHCVHLIHLLIQTLLFSLIELQGKNA